MFNWFNKDQIYMEPNSSAHLGGEISREIFWLLRAIIQPWQSYEHTLQCSTILMWWAIIQPCFFKPILCLQCPTFLMIQRWASDNVLYCDDCDHLNITGLSSLKPPQDCAVTRRSSLKPTQCDAGDPLRRNRGSQLTAPVANVKLLN